MTLTFALIIAIALATITLAFVWYQFKSRESISRPSSVVITLTGAAGLMLAFVSMSLSISFGISMGKASLFLSWVFPAMFLGISISQFTLVYWLPWLITKEQPLGFMLVSVFLVLSVIVDILAGQALISSLVDAQKEDRLQASSAYSSIKAQEQELVERVQELAITEQVRDDALQAKEDAYADANALIGRNVQLGWSNCSGFPESLCTPLNSYRTKTKELNAELSPLQRTIENSEALIQQYNDYVAAKGLLNDVRGQDVKAVIGGEHLTYIIWLSDITGIEPNLIEARMYVGIATLNETLAIMLLYLFGAARKQRSDESVQDDDSKLNVPFYGNPVGANFIPTQLTPEPFVSSQPVKDELVDNQSVNNQSVDNQSVDNQSVNNQSVDNQSVDNQSVNNQSVDNQSVERVPLDLSQKKGKGRVGLIDECIDCGADYRIKVAHQLRCGSCSSQSRKNYIRNKK